MCGYSPSSKIIFASLYLVSLCSMMLNIHLVAVTDSSSRTSEHYSDNRYRQRVEDQSTPLDILNIIKNETTKSKDTTLKTMLSSRGMACAGRRRLRNKPNVIVSIWAHRSIVWTYSIDDYEREKYVGMDDITNQHSYNFNSNHRPMGNWIRNLSASNELSSLP